MGGRLRRGQRTDRTWAWSFFFFSLIAFGFFFVCFFHRKRKSKGGMIQTRCRNEGEMDEFYDQGIVTDSER